MRCEGGKQNNNDATGNFRLTFLLGKARTSEESLRRFVGLGVGWPDYDYDGLRDGARAGARGGGGLYGSRGGGWMSFARCRLTAMSSRSV